MWDETWKNWPCVPVLVSVCVWRGWVSGHRELDLTTSTKFMSAEVMFEHAEFDAWVVYWIIISPLTARQAEWDMIHSSVMVLWNYGIGTRTMCYSNFGNVSQVTDIYSYTSHMKIFLLMLQLCEFRSANREGNFLQWWCWGRAGETCRVR